MDAHPAEQIGRIRAGGRQEPAAGVSATQRRRREQPTDQRIAVAHRSQQQLRCRRRHIGIAPEPIRTEGVDEKRDARGKSDAARKEPKTVDSHGPQPRSSYAPATPKSRMSPILMSSLLAVVSLEPRTPLKRRRTASRLAERLGSARYAGSRIRYGLGGRTTEIRTRRTVGAR